jgi:choline-glycine betaine transporter
MSARRAAGVVLAVIALIAVPLLFAVTDSTFSAASYSDCDNLAGECLRVRQHYALRGIGVLSVIVAGLCVWSAIVGFRRGHRWWQALVVLTAVVVLATVQATDPVDHLDNRYSGWLSD